jgi:hydroquinone glucosyltransferase
MYQQLTRRSFPNLRALLCSISSPDARPLAALVSDFLCSEVLLVAAELGVPGYIFVPTNLAWLSLRRQLLKLHQCLPPGEYRDFPEVVELAEGVSMRRVDLLVLYRDPKRLPFPQLLEDSRRYLLADGFLVNTFYEMEPALVEAFKLATEGGAFPPVFAAGPLVRPQSDAADASPCLQWLDRQPTGSVVYVSLGSGRAPSLEQTTELAAGIEDSGQRFLWVMRMPANLTTTSPGGNKDDPLAWLPEGFLERTAGRGLAVTAWAPQVRALSHRATAAFVSHCG